jgi:PucR family transcriptional regulator, purine catabolism regulatory protein
LGGYILNNNLDITVADILKKESFKDIKIVSGEKGLYNIVKWTHIIESEKFISSLNGGELILTTGIGLASHAYANLSFIEQLMNKQVAAICIELGNTFRSISPEIKKLSDEKNIPIIVFPGIVKFVDITHDIHKFMVNSHYETLNRLYKLSKRFNELSLLPNGILKILQELHTNFGKPIYYIQRGNTSFYYPPHAKDMEIKISHHLRDQLETTENIVIEDQHFIISSVKNTNQLSGYLCLQMEPRRNSDFIRTVLDHASLAISQIILRNEIAEERKQFTEDEMVQEFLRGQHRDIDKLDSILPFSYKNASFRVIVLLVNHKETKQWHDWKEAKLRITYAIRKLFKQHHLFPVISIRENEISVIAFTTSISKQVDHKSPYENIATVISTDKELQDLLPEAYDIGIGKMYNQISDIPRTFTEAKRVIELKKLNIIHALLYEDIGIYDVLFHINNREQTEAFIQTHLGGILQLEPKMREELLTTLEAFLDYNSSYKEASQSLYVVRQTLYHRINKLQEILGINFLSPPNRLALEFSIKAYRYFESN